MKTFIKEELKLILDNHKLWLNDANAGQKADLSYADLSFANLSSANLSSANLYFANFHSADLSSANLHSANLYSANLHSAGLSSANLHSANLSFANLHSANLSFANLHSANLSFANLSSANLYFAKTDKVYVQVSYIGSRKGMTTYCVDDDYIWCGCWKGELKEFIKRVKETHKDNKQFLDEYQKAIKFFKTFKKKGEQNGKQTEGKE